MAVPKTFGLVTGKPVLESLFGKVAGIQDCCKTLLLHAHLRIYFT